MQTLFDFTTADQGVGHIVKVFPRKDPGADDTVLWDIDFLFDLDNPEEAAVLETTIPGAREFLIRARDGKGSYDVKAKPSVRDVTVAFARYEDGDQNVSGVAGEIRFAKLRATERVRSCLLRLRLFAMPHAHSTDITTCLDKKVTISLVPRQDETTLAAEPQIGDVVAARVGDLDVYGIYTKKVGKTYAVDDFGVTHKADSITSCLKIVDDKGWADEYVKRSKAVDVVPSWSRLIVALGQSFGGGDTDVHPDETTWVLKDSIVDAAIELPPEAGS